MMFSSEGYCWFSYANGKARFRIDNNDVADKLSVWRSPEGYLNIRFVRNDAWADENCCISQANATVYFHNPSKAKLMDLYITVHVDDTIQDAFADVMDLIAVHVLSKTPPVLQVIGADVVEINPTYRNLSTFSDISGMPRKNGRSVEIDVNSEYPYVSETVLRIPNKAGCLDKPMHMTEEDMLTWNEVIFALNVDFINHQKFVRNIITANTVQQKRDVLLALLDDDEVVKTIPELTCSMIDAIRAKK